MFDELRLQLLELYQWKESSKLTDEEKERLLTVIKNMETRIEQLETTYSEVSKTMNHYLESVRTLLKQRVPSYDWL